MTEQAVFKSVSPVSGSTYDSSNDLKTFEEVRAFISSHKEADRK